MTGPVHRHSTGRGGAANFAHTPTPGVEHPQHQHSDYISSGRGGAGNISRDRSASRDPAHRASSKDKEKHGIAGFLRKVTHPHEQNERSTTEEAAVGDRLA